ncbi:MAG: hypothetical protein LBK65_08835 [Tannerellaceae bacterium]|jgi:hypothetical protein|nr:hypothetical protein [Tannerellaceae bacterium]
MLKRDFIMVQIEELGKVIAQIISQRDTDAARKSPALIQGVYNSLKIDPGFLMSMSPQDIRRHLDEEDGAGLQRMELAAKVMIEDAFLNTEKQKELRLKSKEMLEYVQVNDRSFSLERAFLLEELKQ